MSPHRQFCYLSDEQAREQAEALCKHDAVAEDYAIGSLLAWLGVLALSAGAALASLVGRLGEVLP